MAGLDVGWGQQLDMAPDPRYQHRFLLQRELPPGCYTYKFVIVSRPCSHQFAAHLTGNSPGPSWLLSMQLMRNAGGPPTCARPCPPMCLPLPPLFPLQDGRWGYAPNSPTKMDGDNLNNWVAVPYRNTDPAVQVRLKGYAGREAGRQQGTARH